VKQKNKKARKQKSKKARKQKSKKARKQKNNKTTADWRFKMAEKYGEAFKHQNFWPGARSQFPVLFFSQSRGVRFGWFRAQ